MDSTISGEMESDFNTQRWGGGVERKRDRHYTEKKKEMEEEERERERNNGFVVYCC